MVEPNMNKAAQRKAAFIFGVAFVVTILILATIFPTPTAFQYQVFRAVLALAAGGIAAMVPGFLEVQIKALLRAGGALAVFVMVYFFNPAQLVANTPVPPPVCLGGEGGKAPGAGGGGGGAVGVGAGGGAGGSGGEVASHVLRAEDLPNAVQITVGRGGKGGTNGGGEDGGDTTFGDLLRARGGRGGGSPPNK